MNRIPPDICKSCAGCTNSSKSTCGIARQYIPIQPQIAWQPTPGCQLFGLRSRLPMAPGSLWQIDTGIVRAGTWNKNGTVTTLGFWGPDSLISRSLKEGESFFVECLTPVSAWSLPPDAWPQCTDALMLQMQENFAYVEIVGCRRVPVSLEKLFLWLAKRFGRLTEQGYLIDMRLTHQDLADAIGSTRVTITRTLKDLEQQGVCRRVARGRFLVAQSTLDSQTDTSFSSCIPMRQATQFAI